MAKQRLNLTRDQLASFLSDFEQVKQFEKLFSTVDSIDTFMLDEISTSAATAGASANEALASISALSDLVAPLVVAPPPTGGTVTSVAASGGTTGLTFTGSPITTSGTLTLGGTLAVVNGGTGQTSYTDGQLLIGNSTGNTLTKATLIAGANVTITNGPGSITIAATGGGGTVTSVSVVSANGLAGTVATATTTPAITLSTTVTGIVKGNGTALLAATAGTDYVAPGAYTASGLTMATSRLLGRTTAGTGAAEEISVAGGLTLTGGVLTGTSGTVTSVTGTAPVVSSGGSTPAISMAAASTSVNGYLTSTDWNTFNSKGSGSVTSVSGTGSVNGITLTGTVTSSGSLTLGGTLSGVSLTSQVSGTLPVTNGGTGTATAFTSGSVVFAGASGIYSQDNANFFWDDANNRLGLGTASPGSVLEINKAAGAADLRISVGGVLYGNLYASSSDTTLTSVTAIPLVFGTNATTRFQIGSVGQWGIGGATYGTAGQVFTSGGALAAPTWTTPTTGTVTSVGGTGSVNGITLTGTVTSSGSLTLGGTLSGVSLTSQVSGTLPIANGGTNATTASDARTNLGATTVGSNFFTLTNPSAITFPRINADNSVSTLDAATFRTAIGAGTSSTVGTVTSVGGTGTVNGITLTGTVTSSGNLTLGGTLSGVNLTTQVTGTLPVANGGTGATTFTANALLKGNTTSAVSASNVSDNGSTVSIASGIGFSVARTTVTAPAAADGNVFSGTYTPTSFNTTNIAASTPQSAQYLRVGNTVTVSGQIDIDPTATGFAILGLSLPVASSLTSAVQLSGVFNCPDAAGGGIYGDAANDRATFQMNATSASNLTYYYTFTYRVL